MRARLPYSPSSVPRQPRFASAKRPCSRTPSRRLAIARTWRDNMHRKATMALAVAAALGLPHSARAQNQDQLRTLREQVRQLDRRVKDAEQAAIHASNHPATETTLSPP